MATGDTLADASREREQKEDFPGPDKRPTENGISSSQFLPIVSGV